MAARLCCSFLLSANICAMVIDYSSCHALASACNFSNSPHEWHHYILTYNTHTHICAWHTNTTCCHFIHSLVLPSPPSFRFHYWPHLLYYFYFSFFISASSLTTCSGTYCTKIYYYRSFNKFHLLHVKYFNNYLWYGRYFSRCLLSLSGGPPATMYVGMSTRWHGLECK